jgi:hypothetical protein
VCAVGWATEEKNGVRLHHLTYRDTKAACPGLVSDLLIQARVKATEAIKSAFARRKAGRKASCPQSQACAARYNVHTYKLDWQTASVRLSTTDGRLTVPFQLPRYAAKYAGCDAFAQLRSFLAYKAEERGMQVVAVDPRHTSQTCFHWGYQHRSNRRSQALFQCRQCGYRLNADLNGAHNIALKHLVSLGTSLADGPLSIGLSSPQRLTARCEGQAPQL